MRFLIYLLRWQISGIVLYPALLFLLPQTNELLATIVSNFIGGCTFYWVDFLIFGRKQ